MCDALKFHQTVSERGANARGLGLCSDVVAICSDAGEWSLQSVRLRRWRRHELQHSTSLHASLGNKAAASGTCDRAAIYTIYFDVWDFLGSFF